MNEEIIKEYPDFNFDFFKGHLRNGKLIDARKGGLVLGKPHPEVGQSHLNNIHVLFIRPNLELFLLDLLRDNPEDLVAYFGSIEGGEYILCAEAKRKYEQLFDEINADLTPSKPIQQITITNHTRIINAFDEGDNYLLVDSQFAIVNKHATARNLADLELMNALIK